MKPVFVDTSALIALGNQRDNFNMQAKSIKRELVKTQRKFITTSLVIVEVCNVFSGLKFRSTAIEIVEGINQSNKWIYIDVDKELMARGFKRFKQMRDKEWGLVDCVSMIVAEEYDSTDIFTNDSHFKQAGFNILLK
ncbi:MAG: PIN domain-containing protein [Candidatus Scalindua sp.]|nr:PIN domain-containing protein [Candidatus Scalindua sp.]